MKSSLLSVLPLALLLGACSGGNSSSSSDGSLTDSGTLADSLSMGESLESAQLINSSQLGLEPNYWQCELTQVGASVPIDEQYQFFADQTGAVAFGSSTGTFRWELHQDSSGRLDIYNDAGLISHERWFVDSLSPTVFMADIAYADSEQELEGTTFVDTDASLMCILYLVDVGPVNPDDIESDLLDDESNALEPSSTIPPVAQAIVNTNSSFGLENELWSCITDDGSLDLLLGFYSNGIGGTYSTRTGTLQGAQSSYSVTQDDSGASVLVNAVFDNEADQLELLDVVFERRFQFSTRIRSAALDVDTTATCDIIPTSELPL